MSNILFRVVIIDAVSEINKRRGVILLPSMIVDPSKCTKCGTCIKVCPAGIVKLGDSGLPEMDVRLSGRCIECGHCALFCPESANCLSFLKNDEMVAAADLAIPESEEALNFIKTRRSIRRFRGDPLPQEVFDRLFEAVKNAPTASNRQPVRWIVSKEPEKTKEITNLILCWMREEIFRDPTSQAAIIGAAMIAKAKAGEDALLRGAPHAVLAVVPKGHMWPEDGSIALTYLELSAHALGAGACWGGFLTAAVRSFRGLREYLGIGEDEHVCGAQMIGYPLIIPVRQFPPRKQQNISWIV